MNYLEIILNTFKNWGATSTPEYLIQWVKGIFAFSFILLPVIMVEILRRQSRGHIKPGPYLDQEEMRELKKPKIDDPAAMINGFESIKEWIKEYGIPWSDVNLIYRENPENVFARFHLPNTILTNEDIESFMGMKLKDHAFEPLFRAKLWLSSTRGTLNVFRPPSGGTSIDALIKTDRTKDILFAEIKNLDSLLGLNKSPAPPDFYDTILDSLMLPFRLIKGRLANHRKIELNSPKSPPAIVISKR